jgi:hypothetical protein
MDRVVRSSGVSFERLSPFEKLGIPLEISRKRPDQAKSRLSAGFRSKAL